MKLAKFLMVFGVLFACLLSYAAPALAQAAKPQYNPQCWAKKDCIDEKKNMGSTEYEAANGWIQEGDCVGDWGKCLAGTVTVAEVSFGGNAEFKDLGVYIKTIYNYSMVIIGILAVVVIVIAGAQWTSSAGNAEVIGRAKKRITGAVIGIFIAFMSYNILNTINPATINLRLPQVWLLRSIALAEPPCLEQKNIVGADVSLPINEPFFEAYKKIKPNTTLTKDHTAKLLQTQCGVVYDLPDGDKCKGSTCKDWADAEDATQICGEAHPCACFYDSKSGQSFCKSASIGGTINLNKTTAIKDWYVDNVQLVALCSDAPSSYFLNFVSQQARGADDTEYSFVVVSPDTDCGDVAGATLVGYFMGIEVNDADPGATVDDLWIVGKKSCGAGSKPIAGNNGFNLATVFWQRPVDPNSTSDIPFYEVKKALLDAMTSAGHLWTAADVKNGVTCDFITNVPPYNIGLSDEDLTAGLFYMP